MNGSKRVARTVAIGACAALLLVGWYLFAPRQLGGRASYVTTSGSSMEPEVRRGDFIVVHESPEYRVGDVVAYRNPDVGQVVLHRIVAMDGPRFVLKGDANTWLDSYRPTEDELYGEMAFRVPGLGGRLSAVRSPWGMSAVISVAALALFGGHRRRRAGEAEGAAAHEDAPAARARADRAPSSHHGRSPGSLSGVLAGMAALALVLGIILFAIPSTTTAHRDVAYEQQGAFSYAGAVPEEGVAVYGRPTIETGDPVYLELTDRILVTFEYSIATDAPLDASGTVGLAAEVSDVNGWTRTMELAPTTSFERGKARVRGELDLRSLQEMTAELERITGVERDHYTVTVRPAVSVEGTLAGRPFSDSFSPELRFFLDPLQLQLEPEGAAPIGEEAVDPLNPVAGGLLTIERTVPRTFSLFGLDLGLEPLRAATLVVLILVGAGLVWIRLDRSRSARRGEAALIESRYGRYLVPVRAGDAVANGRTVRVDSFDSLVRLATHYGHVVLHESGDGFDAYSVEEDGVTYRYLVANGSHR
jgi:signal peptidase